MKIAIEAVNANKPPEHGCETYLYNLIRSIFEIDRKDTFYLYVDQPVNEQARIIRDNVIYRHVREIKYLYGLCKRTFFDDPWSEFFVALDLLLRVRPDIYIFTAGSRLPFIKPYLTLCTVHDFSTQTIPDCYSDQQRHQFINNISTSLKAADHVVAVSNRTKKDAIDFVGLPEDKITVIYHGYNRQIFNINRDQTKLSQIKKKLNISSTYIITTGMIHPKKNLVRLARAFKSVKSAGKFDGQLLIVGPDKYKGDEIRREIKGIDSAGDIIFAGCLPILEMAELIKGAELFVFPALYEGFGLSLLEAMACGIPVVAANAGALPEVADGNVLLVDPYDVEKMSQAMAEALNNSGLRNQLRQGALRRAEQFSWDKAARQYLNLFKELGARKPLSVRRNGRAEMSHENGNFRT